jgi:hypothetical protein
MRATKTCNKCGKRKNTSNFYKGRGVCKTCFADQIRKYARAHREKRNAQSRQYYREHRERLRRVKARWTAEHREQIKAYNKKYYWSHRAYFRAKKQEYLRRRRERKARELNKRK